MKNSLLFRVKSVGLSTRGGRKPCSLISAARHNLREIQQEQGARAHIHSHLSHKNQVLHGPVLSSDVLSLAEKLIQHYAVPRCKFRRDHVQAIEFLISLPCKTELDVLSYFRASLSWLIKTFGSEMILNAVVHLDEEAPHMHALVLPIKDGQYLGGALISRPRLPGLVKSFAQEVGLPHGLSFEPKLRLTSMQRNTSYQLVLDALRANSDPILLSRLWGLIEAHIKNYPVDFLDALGLKLPPTSPSKMQRTLTQVMTSTGKKTSEDCRRSKGHNQSCVGFRRTSQRNSTSGPKK